MTAPAAWVVGALAIAGLLLQGPVMSEPAPKPAPKLTPKPAPKRELGPLPSSKTALVPFDISPFPYRGQIPEKNRPFIDVMEGERLGHNSARGGIYWEDQT
jgi:hypothetical protein